MATSLGPASIEVRVLRASGLAAADANGFSDPYAKISIGKQYVGQTEVLHKTLDPVWSREQHIEPYLTPELSTFMAQSTIRIEVWDSDVGDDDDFIGGIIVSGEDLLGAGGAKEAKSADAFSHVQAFTLDLRKLASLRHLCKVTVTGNISIEIKTRILSSYIGRRQIEASTANQQSFRKGPFQLDLKIVSVPSFTALTSRLPWTSPSAHVFC